MNFSKAKPIVLLALIALSPSLSACAINDALNKYVGENKRSLVPFALEFKPLDATEAAQIAEQGKSIDENLNDAFIDWKIEICANINCNNNPPMLKAMFEGMPIARPDLNRDGKKDLVINVLQYSGIGNCGLAEYRFFENTGRDFRPIGKARITQAQTIYEIDDAHKGQFKTLLFRAKLDCENKPINSEERHSYDKSNARYFPID